MWRRSGQAGLVVRESRGNNALFDIVDKSV
jgi:hypothetical protein